MENSRIRKHRAWHKVSKTMLYDTSFNIFKWIEEGQPIQIMDYTGLKDKNGVEIYEGDILKYDSGYNGFVRFDYGWAIEYQNHSHDMPQYYCNNLTIIGNIHENPELIN